MHYAGTAIWRRLYRESVKFARGEHGYMAPHVLLSLWCCYKWTCGVHTGKSLATKLLGPSTGW
jgi:hypothetical protein